MSSKKIYESLNDIENKYIEEAEKISELGRAIKEKLNEKNDMNETIINFSTEKKASHKVLITAASLIIVMLIATTVTMKIGVDNVIKYIPGIDIANNTKEPSPDNVDIGVDGTVIPSDNSINEEQDGDNKSEEDIVDNSEYNRINICEFGSEYEFDLDGDNTKDKIVIKAEADDIDEDLTNITFVINGKEYLSEDYGLMNATTEYYIIDIDKNDGKLDIALSCFGFSDDPLTLFYNYTDKNIIEIGNISNIAQLIEFGYNGEEGKMCTETRSDFMHTWAVERIFVRSDDVITNAEQEMFNVIHCSEHVLKKELTVYVDNNTSSNTLKIEPQSVIFDKTDEKNWIHVIANDGTEGWMYCEASENFMESENKINGQPVTVYFDDMYYAG